MDRCGEPGKVQHVHVYVFAYPYHMQVNISKGWSIVLRELCLSYFWVASSSNAARVQVPYMTSVYRFVMSVCCPLLSLHVADNAGIRPHGHSQHSNVS